MAPLSLLALFLATCLPVSAGELAIPTTAKLVLMISKGAGEGGKVMVPNEALAAEFRKAGAEVVASSKVAWASSLTEARSLLMQGRLVLCGDMNILRASGALALVEEEGRPKMILNTKNASKSGITLSDQILKAAVAQ